LPQELRHKDGNQCAKKDRHPAEAMDARRVAAILAVARAELHEDVVAAGTHQAEAFVALDSGLAHVGAAPEVAPLPVHLLPDLAAHRGSHALQVLQLRRLLAVRNGQGAIVEGIPAFGIVVAAAIPAFDRLAWKIQSHILGSVCGCAGALGGTLSGQLLTQLKQTAEHNHGKDTFLQRFHLIVCYLYFSFLFN